MTETLQIGYLVPIGMTAEGLAKRMSILVKLVRMLLNDKIRLNARLADSLAEVFHTTPEFWIELQSSASHDVEKAWWQRRAA